ncbi:DUF6547 domain-containing protein, partial [Dysosmobacter welbionis]
GPLLGVLLQEGLGHDGLFIDVVSKVDAHGFTSSCALNVLQNSGRGGQPAWNRCTASQARPNTAHRHRANTAPLRLRCRRSFSGRPWRCWPLLSRAAKRVPNIMARKAMASAARSRIT